MINLYNAELASLSIHKVGNKSRAEGLFVSQTPYQLSDELQPLIKEYFFKAFREKEENYYRFDHETDLSFNTLFSLSSRYLKTQKQYINIVPKLPNTFTHKASIHTLNLVRYI